MLKASLCDYSDAYIPASGTITVVGRGADDAARAADRTNKQAIYKNCAPFTDCITEINNTQVDNAKDTDVVILMYNSIKYSDNYLKTLCCCNVTYAFQSESTLYSCLNVKEFLDRSRCEI